jgi:hypothetical protein
MAAAGSGASILLYALGWVKLTYSVAIMAPLVALVCIALFVRSGRGGEDVLADRLRGGLLAGAVGLVCYDVARQLVVASGLVSVNPFRTIEIYGLLVADRAQDSGLTRTVGWGFHIWNGLSFGLMYTLALGKGRLPWALMWGMVLEAATLATYPSISRLALDSAFVEVSLVGHLAFGLGLGATARSAVRT